MDPNNLYALDNKSYALYNLGNYDGVIAYYDKALTIDPLFEDALVYKAIVLENSGNIAEAIKYYNKVLAVIPGNTYAIGSKDNATDTLNYLNGASEY